jgi:hypothetical protein
MLTVLPTVNTTGKMLRNVDRIGRLRTDTSGSLLLFVAVWLYGTRGPPSNSEINTEIRDLEANSHVVFSGFVFLDRGHWE